MSPYQLDALGIHVLPTYYPGEEKPWGYEVYGPRFVREEARYISREDALRAGLQAGQQELKRHQAA